MKNTDIESFLRDNKPQVRENPAFLLEVQRKMRAVDGIKSEVDRQRKYGRQSMVAALLAGLISGIAVAILAYFYPVDPDTISKDLITEIRLMIEPLKHYLLLLTAVCAVALGVIFSRRRQNSISGL